MGTMYRHTLAKTNVENFRHNLTVLKNINAGHFFCPMIKANAYGHGDVQLAKILREEGVAHIGVALVEEGVHLRQHGFRNQSVLVFNPIQNLETAKAIIENHLTPVISSFESLLLLEKNLINKKMSVHLKFNTGMSRLGMPLTDLEKIKKYFHRSSKLKIQVSGVCTHLHTGEDLGAAKSYSDKQLKLMGDVANELGHLTENIHVFNSCSLIAKGCLGIKSQFGSRPGISLYGIKPKILVRSTKAQKAWQKIVLKPVLQIESNIALVQKVKKGECISYNSGFIAKRNSTIGVVPVGYADGYSRCFSNVGKMLCRGDIIDVRGRVCMDFTMVDLTNLQEPRGGWVNEPVVILGRQKNNEITATQLAEIAHTNEYEIFTNISHRVPRVNK
jgi:alanine racemase